MNGKDKCNRLREIRRALCQENGIPYAEEPCLSSGEGCIGTCPRCDRELRRIAQALEERRRRGLPIVTTAATALYRSWPSAR